MRPSGTPRWSPTRGASGGQVSRLRGSGRATVTAMELQRPDGRTDVLAVALVAFFLALIVTVATLLLLPVLL